LVAFGDGGQGTFSASALPYDFVHPQLAEGLCVEALGEGDDQAVALGTDQLVVVQFDDAGDVARPLLSDQTDAELGEEFVALLSETEFLVEEELAVFVGRYFVG
jgi:ubiquinone biosynthesis protein UbiJ